MATVRKFKARYDIARLQADMALRGWLATDLARAANVSAMTVGRFLDGHTQTARTADKLAQALGYTVKRYFKGVRISKNVAA